MEGIQQIVGAFPEYGFDGDFFSLPYSRYHDDDHVKNRMVIGLAGSNSSTTTGYESSWLFPLYYHDSDSFITPLFGTAHDSSWLFPLYYHAPSLFFTPIFGKTENTHWTIPFYYKGDDSFYTLFYGHNPRCRWFFPLYYGDKDITLVTPLYGRSQADNSEWLFPLYYRDYDSFITPLFGMDKGSTWLVPIFYNDDQWTIVSPLYGRSKKSNAEWLIPLYHRESGRSFTSLPYSWRGGTEQTNSYFATILAGIRSGRTQGSWLFPLYDVKKDTSFDHCATMLDESRLPDEITVRKQRYTNLVWNAKTKTHDIARSEWRLCANSFHSRNEKTFLIFSDADDKIDGHIGYGDENNTYCIARRKKLGNRLFFNRDDRRTVSFNVSTRQKVADYEMTESSLFLFLYNHERKLNRISTDEYERYSVLWRFWHWEDENGNVSLDVFPGFTYDSKTNGYSKTSFLWRFFRYENDPEKGKKVDVLFIPTWR